MALSKPPEGGVIKLGPYSIDLMDEKGRGTFGTVYKGIHTKTRGEVAVKKMQISSDKMGSEGLEEIKKFEKISAHENIVRLHDFHYLDQSFWMIMEFCESGDLDAYMKANDVDMETRLRFMSESASALAHMHNQATPVIHRDIKPGNILLKHNSATDTLVIKLTDFGLSKMVSVDEMMKTAMFNTVVGTPGFMAPELYMRLPYNHTVDIFALGLVFLAMLSQKKGENLTPVSTSGMIMAVGQEMMMRHTMKQPMPDLVTADPNDSPKVKATKDLIKQMTLFEPKDRISMTDVDSAMKGGAAASGPASIPGKMLNRKRLPTPPSDFEISPDSSLRITNDGDDDEEDGLGMALLREALGEHVKHKVDQLSTTVKREEVNLVKEATTMELFKRACDADKFEDHERVVVDSDADRVKRLQKGHGGWNESMREYLGKEGEVVGKRFTQVDVMFPDGKKWAFNPEAVHHIGGEVMNPTKPQKTAGVSVSPSKKTASAKFSTNDIVVITSDAGRFEELQRSAGLWQDWLIRVCGLSGIVHSINEDHDIVVEVITGEKIYVHGDALSHVDQSELEVEAGDLVYVKHDLDEVKKNQEGFGGWNPQMAEMMGHATTVKRVVGQKAILEDGGQRWAFNIKSLLVVAKNRDLMGAIMAKRSMTGEHGNEVPCKVQ